MADQYVVCRDCQTEFLFSEGEQVFFAQKGLSTPSRCPECRQARRRQRENGEGGGMSRSDGGMSRGYGDTSRGYGDSSRGYGDTSRGDGGMSRGGYGSPRPGPELFEVICAECGQKTQVPFKPRGTRPVYCRDCFTAQRR